MKGNFQRRSISKLDAIMAIKPEGGALGVSVTNETDIDWGSQSPISDADIEAKRKELQDAEDALAYQDARKKAFEEIEDQLDLLYKDLIAGKLDATGEWAKHIAKVKADNPKPSS